MENNISPKISDRLTEIGWKKSFLMHWFGNSAGKLYNIIKQHKPLIEVSEYNLVAYFARCKPTALVYGGGQNGLFKDTEFVESIYAHCEYTAKKEFFEKLDDDEISKFLKKIGFPPYFFNEMLEGRLRVPEAAVVEIARYFKQDDVEFIFDYNSLDNKNKDEIKEKEISVSFEEAAKLFDQKPSVIPYTIGQYHPIEHIEHKSEDKKYVQYIADILKGHYRDISVDDLEKLGQLCKHYSKVKRDLDDLL